MDGDNTSNDSPAAVRARLEALGEEHALAVDAECAAYLAAHGDEMRRELDAAGATRPREVAR